MNICLPDHILDLARRGVDIETITMVLRSMDFQDSEIALAYDEVSEVTSTEVVRGQYYIRLDR